MLKPLETDQRVGKHHFRIFLVGAFFYRSFTGKFLSTSSTSAAVSYLLLPGTSKTSKNLRTVG